MKVFRALFALLIGYGFFISPVNACTEPVRILAFGDSLTAGYGLAKEDSYPVRLEDALNQRGNLVEVTNAGVSGDTTSGGLSRLGWALSPKPDIVILELGANDGMRGIDPATTKANLDIMIMRMRKQGITVLLTGMLAPPNLGKDYGAEFQAIYPNLAAKYDVALYPFFLDGVAAQPHLNQDDAIHPNADGIGVLVDKLTPVVEGLIETLP